MDDTRIASRGRRVCIIGDPFGKIIVKSKGSIRAG